MEEALHDRHRAHSGYLQEAGSARRAAQQLPASTPISHASSKLRDGATREHGEQRALTRLASQRGADGQVAGRLGRENLLLGNKGVAARRDARLRPHIPWSSLVKPIVTNKITRIERS